MGTRGGGGGGDVLAPRRPCPPTRQGPDTKGVVEEGRGRPASKVSKIAGMFQAGGGGEEGCGGGGAGEGGAPSGPSAATVVRTESHLARFNTARALFEKMGQGDARPQRTRTAAPATASLTNKAPPAKAEPEAPRGVAVRAGVGRGGDCLLSPQGDSLSPSSSRSASPSPARPAANGHAHHDDGSRGGLAGLGGLRRPGSASSRSLSASSTDSDPPGRRWPPSARAADPADPSRPAEQPDARRWPPHRAADPPHRAADPPRTNGEGTGVRRSSRPEKPAKPDTLADRRAAAASHDAHQELLARHKNWFQSFAKNRQSGPGRPPSPGKADPRPASPTKGEAARGEPRPEDWRAALNTTARTDLRSPRGGPHADDTTTTTAEDTTTTTTPTTAPTITPTNNNITTAPLANNNNNNNNSTCLTTTTTTTTTTTAASRVTASPPPPSAAAAGGGGGSSEQEAWTSVLQTRYGTRTRPDIYSPRLRGDSLDSSSGGGGDWRRERAAILLGRSGQRHSTSEDDVVTKGYTRTLHHDAPAPHGPPAPPRFEDASTLQSGWSPPHKYGLAEGGKTTPIPASSPLNPPEKTKKEVNNVEKIRTSKENGRGGGGGEEEEEEVEEVEGVTEEMKKEADLIVSESVVLKDATKEKDAKDSKDDKEASPTPLRPPSPPVEPQGKEGRVEEGVERARRVGHSKEDSEVVNTLLRDTILGVEGRRGRGRRGVEGGEGVEEGGVEERGVRGYRRSWEERENVTRVEMKNKPSRPAASYTPPPPPPPPPPADTPSDPPVDLSPPPTPPSPPLCGDVVVGGVVSVLKAETVYVSSSEDLSQLEDSRKDPRRTSSGADSSPEDKIKQDIDLREEDKLEEEEEEEKKEEEEEEEEVEIDEVGKVKRQLFPDLLAECEGVRGGVGRGESEEAEDSIGVITPPELPPTPPQPITPPDIPSSPSQPPLTPPEPPFTPPEPIISPPPPPIIPGEEEGGEGGEGGVESAPPPPLSPRTQSLAALDALIHGTAPQAPTEEPPQQAPPPQDSAPAPPPPPQEDEEIMYDHTVISAQHKLQFCTAPMTVEGLVAPPPSDTPPSTNGSDPEPLPPPIPPHGPPPTTTAAAAAPSPAPSDPEVMTAEEAQQLLSAKETHGVLSDEEAQEIVLLLSPTKTDAPHTFTPQQPPTTQEPTPPPVPPHYTTSGQGDEYDGALTSPLSPEDVPSEHDSSEASGVGVAGDGFQVTRVKEVLVEDGVHYLEDGHFWVEVPGIPEEDEDEDDDPAIPFHPHTKLTFSTQPVQVFSTYSVTEYDRKNDEVDPVAASAEYELEKRVEKMDVFPVEIVKGEGGLGLSIIGMGVGADAGVEKLGIFVKTITPGGATEKDARIQVNDQIIEVDGKSLVGVTQVFAASVLKNTSGQVHFLIGREKDPENSEVALLIKQSLQADREREERRRALGGPDYDPHATHGFYDTLSSPSEDNSRSDDLPHHPHHPHHHHPHHHHHYGYMEGGVVVGGGSGGSGPTSPDHTSSPPPEVFELEGDASDVSPDADVGVLKLKLKEVQYRNAIAEAEITKLKMTLLEMEKVVSENTQYTAQLMEAQGKMSELDTKLQTKETEVATYQDMLEQSQGQFIVLEKKYYKAKKIIKEYQGRERDFLHREEYHITQLEDKDSHYNALVKALKDRVIQLEQELTKAQKSAGLPVQVPSDPSTQPAYWNLQQSAQNAALSKLALSS